MSPTKLSIQALVVLVLAVPVLAEDAALPAAGPEEPEMASPADSAMDWPELDAPVETFAYPFGDTGENREALPEIFDECGYRCAFDGRKQAAPHRVTDGGGKTTLKRLREELAVRRRECFLLDFNALGALKTFP